MLNIGQPGRAASAMDDLKDRIVSFMRGASTEITPAEECRLSELEHLLPQESAVYVAHPPNATLAQVIHAALALRRAGFAATPHLALRRIADTAILRAALAELRAGGVDRILLIAGDAPLPCGEFSSTLDIFDSGILEEAALARIGIAGHPEGHGAVSDEILWQALEAKQAYAARAGLALHIVSQFGFDRSAFSAWQEGLARRGIALPLRVGIAGPAPLTKLLHFAAQCGIRASARGVVRNLGSALHARELAVEPDQHLLALMKTPLSPQLEAPHFFAFGGVLETARWMRALAAGDFDIDIKAGRFRNVDPPRR
jgi:methylenetetrahydrofolate reductase (NADPH)